MDSKLFYYFVVNLWHRFLTVHLPMQVDENNALPVDNEDVLDVTLDRADVGSLTMVNRSLANTLSGTLCSSMSATDFTALKAPRYSRH